jgi:hypothetical protein
MHLISQDAERGEDPNISRLFIEFSGTRRRRGSPASLYLVTHRLGTKVFLLLFLQKKKTLPFLRKKKQQDF